MNRKSILKETRRTRYNYLLLELILKKIFNIFIPQNIQQSEHNSELSKKSDDQASLGSNIVETGIFETIISSLVYSKLLFYLWEFL